MFNFFKRKSTTTLKTCIQSRLQHRYAHKLSAELNFPCSNIGTIACFAPDEKPCTSTLYVCDLHFNPVFTYSTNAYINACAISSDGSYAIFQTANADSEDGSKFFLVNIHEKTLLWEKNFPTGWKHMTFLAVDSLLKEIVVSYSSDSYRYNFNGDLVNEEKFKADKIESVLAHISPYSLNEEAATIINTSAALDAESLTYVQNLLCNAEKYPKMSAYQLSITYKLLGDALAKNKQFPEAKAAYVKGLSLNEKLSVKRSLSAVEKALHDCVG